jgi:hypothetical protein
VLGRRLMRHGIVVGVLKVKPDMEENIRVNGNVVIVTTV